MVMKNNHLNQILLISSLFKVCKSTSLQSMPVEPIINKFKSISPFIDLW